MTYHVTIIDGVPGRLICDRPQCSDHVIRSIMETLIEAAVLGFDFMITITPNRWEADLDGEV